MPFIIGASQQKRGGHILNFDTYCAPIGFDRTAQPVDIFEVFRAYYSIDRNAKWIFAVGDTTATSVLTSASNYRYGYTLGGVDYVVDTTKLNTYLTENIGKGSAYWEIPVVSTAGFPSSGKIIFENGEMYIYTSKTSTKFVGSMQYLYGDLRINQEVALADYTITWTGTKRYVIGNLCGKLPMPLVVLSTAYPTWLYAGNCVKTITTPGCSVLKWIHIHDVDNIVSYEYAQQYNSALEGQLYISRSATTIGYNAFRNDSKITGTLTIPGNIIRCGTGGHTFAGCSGLTGLVFKEGVQYIEGYSFQNCTNVNGNLNIPSTVIYIGQLALSGLKITSLTFAEDCAITGIYAQAFQGCTSLTGTPSFPNTITTIGEAAFYNCAFTGTLTIPSSLSSLGASAFALNKFDDIDLNSNSNYEKSDYVLYDVSVPGSVKANYSCRLNSNTITFRSDTTAILNHCCVNNSRTGSLIIPNTVVTIGSSAFQGCTGLTGTLTFQSTSVCTTISGYAFLSVPFTGTLDIPASVTSITKNINDYPVWYGNKFTALTSSSTNYPASDNVLYDVTGGQVCLITAALYYVGTLTMRADTTQVTRYAMYGSKRTGNLTLPDSIVTLGGVCWTNSSGMTGSLIIGSGLSYIGWQNMFGGINFTGALEIRNTAFTGFYGGSFNGVYMTSIVVPVNYTGTWLTWNFSNNLSAASLNQSIINITSGTKTVTIGATNKARLLAAYPTAETDANARGITIA